MTFFYTLLSLPLLKPFSILSPYNQELRRPSIKLRVLHDILELVTSTSGVHVILHCAIPNHTTNIIVIGTGV